MPEELPDLSIDQKLDKIMEAVSFIAQMQASLMVAIDKHFQSKESKIIKPV